MCFYNFEEKMFWIGEKQRKIQRNGERKSNEREMEKGDKEGGK